MEEKEIEVKSIPTWVPILIDAAYKAYKWWKKNGMLGTQETCKARLDKADGSDLAILISLSDLWGNLCLLGMAIKAAFQKKTLEGLQKETAVIGNVDTVKEWLAKQGESERLLGAVLVDFEDFGDVVKKGSKPC